MGIHKYCRNTPILNALKVHKIETTLELGYLELIRTIFKSKSRATSFYTHILNLHVCDKLSSQYNLICRARNVCCKYDMSFVKYIIDDKYALSSQRKLKHCFPVNDGFNDSVRQLLLSNDPYDRTVLNMMLIPF